MDVLTPILVPILVLILVHPHIEVGSRLPDFPLTDPGVRNYRTGLLGSRLPDFPLTDPGVRNYRTGLLVTVRFRTNTSSTGTPVECTGTQVSP